MTATGAAPLSALYRTPALLVSASWTRRIGSLVLEWDNLGFEYRILTVVMSRLASRGWRDLNGNKMY